MTQQPDWDERVAHFLNLVNSADIWREPKECPEGTYRVWPSRAGKLRYKAECVLNVPPERALEYLWRPERRPQWDELCELAEFVGESGGSQVMYMLTKAQWPTSAREEMLWVRQHPTPCGGTAIIGTTCTDGRWDVRGRGVRMTTMVGGQLVYPQDDGKCRLVLLLDNDPGGMLPDWLVRQISASAIPSNIRRIRAALEEGEA